MLRKEPMSRFLTVTLLAGLACAAGIAPLVAQAPAPASTFQPPKTPWGDPDLQGIWPSTDMVGVPFERTWSCTEEGGEPCWACRGCRTREAAFHQAGKQDPMRVVKKA